MPNETDFLKIKVFLLSAPIITSEGFEPRKYNQSDYYDVEEHIREQIIVPINEQIGLHNWGIKFTEHPNSDKRFDALLYAPNEENALFMKGTILNKLIDLVKTCYYKGTINDYIGSPQL